MLAATPMQMGVLVALETLPFALVSLHAGVLLDRARRWVLIAAFTAAIIGEAVCAWWVIHSHYLP